MASKPHLIDTDGGAGLVIQLPEDAGADWHWWLVADGTVARYGTGFPDESADYVLVLVPSARCPVQIEPLGDLPRAQAEAAARLRAEASEKAGLSALHVVASAQGEALLVARTDHASMSGWLARLAEQNIDPQVIFPTSLLLDGPGRAVIGVEAVARNDSHAITAESALVEALGLNDLPVISDIYPLIASRFSSPPLNLRQGALAKARPAFEGFARWRSLARMAAVASLIGLAILLVDIIKLNLNASDQEAEALAAGQARFPAATDLASVNNLLRAELIRRGAGPGSFAAPASAVLSAMQPLPNLSLRDLGYGDGGILRFTAASPNADEINRLLATLQQSGWQVTVPPSLAPDPTGATVAAITVRAP